MSYSIRRITPSHQLKWVEHQERQSGESGLHGQPVFEPFEQVRDFRSEDKLNRQLVSWSKSVCEPGWVVAWGAEYGKSIVGGVTIKGSEMQTQRHRALLGLGIEQAHQRRGLASWLLEYAVDFSKSTGLAYLDLRVFAHNSRAISLYHRFGFQENGRIVDCFRIHQNSVDDVLMTLAL